MSEREVAERARFEAWYEYSSRAIMDTRYDIAWEAWQAAAAPAAPPRDNPALDRLLSIPAGRWSVSDCEYIARTLTTILAESDALTAATQRAEAADQLLRDVQQYANFDGDGKCRCEQASFGLPEYSHPGYYCETCQAADAEQALANHIAALDRAAIDAITASRGDGGAGKA